MIERLSVSDLRSYTKNVTLGFTPGVTFLIGPNGSGKSTLIEALSCVIHGNSFRTKNLSDIVTSTSDNEAVRIARIIAKGSNNNDSFNLEWATDGKRKVLKLDTKSTSSAHIANRIQACFLSGDDLGVVTGGPDKRRAFFDDLLSTHNSEYATCLRAYKRVLIQRNALLEAQASVQARAIWDEQLVALSSTLRSMRLECIAHITAPFNAALAHLLQPSFSASFSYRESIFDERKAAGELALGRTLFGAHLDEISLYCADRASRSQLSRGQQAIVAIFLKLLASNFLSDPVRVSPTEKLVCLDDITSEIDPVRLVQFLTYLAQHSVGQIFVATPCIDISIMPLLAANNVNATIIDVSQL